MLNKMDFTLSAYKQLISTLQSKGYFFQTFEEYVKNSKEKVVMLRHDVDRKPGNSLKTALLENGLGIRASYFFRTILQTLKPEIIKKIADLGHEIGYHYENLTTCGGDFRLAIDDFRLSLEKLRKLYPVKTICMHGSPLSKWDNRDLWKKYDYRDFGIIAEPSFDVDFEEVFYLTDTGRSWNNFKVSVRDKVKKTGVRGQRSEVGNLKLRKTRDIIEALEKGLLPDKVMINTHPQRWDDRFGPWVRELIWQNVKNVVKYFYLRTR